MDLGSQIPDDEIRRLQLAYVGSVMSDAKLFGKFSNWDSDGSARLLSSRTRLAEEFRAYGTHTFSDSLGVHEAEAYSAYANGDIDGTICALEKCAADCFRAIRLLKVAYNKEESNDEANKETMEQAVSQEPGFQGGDPLGQPCP